MYLNKSFSFNEQPSRFIPIVYFLLYAKDLAFCYALLRNDKIRQSDDNIQEISEQCQSKISIALF